MQRKCVRRGRGWGEGLGGILLEAGFCLTVRCWIEWVRGWGVFGVIYKGLLVEKGLPLGGLRLGKGDRKGFGPKRVHMVAADRSERSVGGADLALRHGHVL